MLRFRDVMPATLHGDGRSSSGAEISYCVSSRLRGRSSAIPYRASLISAKRIACGSNGSGTIFFGWCNLRCVFCQNFETSQFGEGAEVSAAELADIMVDLQSAGCHNVSFVTPEHVVPQILEALAIAIDRGSRPPLVYNTLAYDSLESIQLMEGIVDVYMPDFKLWHTENCRNYLVASDYADAARTAIAAMYAQVGELKVDEEGLALRGVLVRHLVMPGLLDDTHEIMHWLAALSPGTYVNVMDQILSRP